MALQKQFVPLQIDRGLDTKLDDKQEEPGFLRIADNVVYETAKKLRKRNGYDELPALPENAKSLAKLRTEILALSPRKAYSFSNSLQSWTEKGPIFSTTAKTRPVYKSNTGQLDTDCLIVDNFAIYTWENSDNTVRYTVQDLSDNSYVVANGSVDSGKRPVLAAAENKVFIVYASGSDLKFKSFFITAPASLSAATTVASTVNTSFPLIDAQSFSDKIVVAFNANNSGANLGIFSVNQNSVASSIIYVSNESASSALTIFKDSLEQLVVMYSDGSYVKYLVYPSNFNAALLAPTTIDEIPNVAATTAAYNTAVFTYINSGASANGRTFEIVINAAAALPTDEIHFTFSGDADDVVLTITPNDGTNNGTVPVNATSERIVEVINSGTFTGGTLVLSDTSSLRTLLSGTGGTSSALTSGDSSTLTFANGTSIPVTACTLVETSSNNFLAHYEFSYAGSGTNFVKSATLTTGGTVGTPSVFARGSGIAARSFRHDGVTYVPIVVDSNVQASYFLLDQSGNLVSKWANQEATGPLSTGVLIEPQLFQNSKYLLTHLYKTNVQSGIFSTNGVIACTLDFDPENPYEHVEFADTLLIAGGFLRLYDGNSITEQGFCTFPETLSNPGNSVSGGSLSDGNRAYVALYAWTDNSGKKHRSAPTAAALSVTLSGGGAVQSSTITVPCLHLTNKTDVLIELYRTEDAGTTYYKTAEIANNVAVNTVNITDTTSDADLISKELLYTTGGVLSNVQAPPAASLAVYNGDRVAVLGDKDYRVEFSKTLEEDGPIEFTGELYRDVDPVGGALTCVAGLADKLIAFSNDSCSYVTGEGPNNLGEQDSLTKFERIPADVGCTEPRSLAQNSQGLFFKSRKGIWLLSPSLGLSYIGARVEQYNSQEVTSAAIVGELNQIRFTLRTNTTLVYNYNLDLWGTFSNHGALDAISAENDYYYIRTSGSVYKENRTSFGDASSSIRMKIETAWLSLVPIQGLQRAYFLLLLGDFKSTHKLKVKIAYDYNSAYTQEIIMTPADFVDATAYGIDSPYGTNTYGGQGSVYQMRLNLAQQRVQAIRISIEDMQEDIGEGFSLSAVTVRVGAKDTGGKIAAARVSGG